MPRLTDAEENENFQQLYEFRSYWENCDGYVRHPSGFVEFPVSITYRWSDKTKRFASKMRTYLHSGPDDGKINIEECRRATIEEFYLQFLPVFQIFRFISETGSLLIKDTSDKMGGAYDVDISPALDRS